MTEIKFNVLIAEDEENIGNFISTILKTNGYKPIIATTGESGDPVCGIILSRCDIIRPWIARYGWNRCDL